MRLASACQKPCLLAEEPAPTGYCLDYEIPPAQRIMRKLGSHVLVTPFFIQTIADDSDRAYMETLYAAYHQRMLAVARRYSAERAEVEDIVSDSWLSIIKKISVLRGMVCPALTAYIVSTVRNAAIDHCRRQKRMNTRLQPTTDEAMAQTADQATVEGEVMRHEEYRNVRAAFLTLPESEREVLSLRYRQDYNDSEIAGLMGVSVNSVRKYALRARQRLKAAMRQGEEL